MEAILLPGRETAEEYARLFVQLKRAGTPIPDNDLWIAALALQHNVMLVTRDHYFERIPQLLRGYFRGSENTGHQLPRALLILFSATSTPSPLCRPNSPATLELEKGLFAGKQPVARTRKSRRSRALKGENDRPPLEQQPRTQ
jgi:hypothetical protein